jgi:hypothetical protein
MAKKRVLSEVPPTSPAEVPPENQEPFPQKTPPGVQPEVEEIDDFRDANNIDSILQEYIAKENLDETAYRASLYRYDKVNKQKQILVDSTVGCVLSPHDIGMSMGSGEYRYVITWPNKRGPTGLAYIKAFRINIGPEYDAKRALTNPPPLPGFGGPVTPPQNPVEAALQLVGALVQMNGMMRGPGAAAVESPAQMAASHLQFQEVMQQTSMQYVEFMRTMRKQMLAINDVDDYEDEEEDEPGDDELVKTIKELAVTFLPKLLGNGPGAKITAAAVRSMPQFKKITKNPVTAAHLLAELEKDFGKEKVDAVCERLKIKRP